MSKAWIYDLGTKTSPLRLLKDKQASLMIEVAENENKPMIVSSWEDTDTDGADKTLL